MSDINDAGQLPDRDGNDGPKRNRTLLALVAVAALAVGFLLGFLARIPLEDSRPADPVAGSVDVGFAQDMTVHHNQAIEMAAVALTNSDDQYVRNLSYDILTTQQNQVGQMQGWLTLWGQPPLPSGQYMAWMTETGEHGHASGEAAHAAGGDGVGAMPGMASAEDLAELRAARGTELDVLFLQLMLRHHEGGLPMMEYGAQYASITAVRNLAQTMVNTQTGESELMTTMLAERGAEPLPLN
ncbi:DUF305 domain-containing protein [Rhodococcus chondri]|uniref:DUF305 domain-containing protein n=1 Tax=Rhodococcus chondri TaxID=3065941 RepID=A0ABU7JUR1_9NOCA|nr:DUF305 domain-containing protein [Rhodococcus sp. CC-R104]MEE2033761.1 DUF305 domain-containing protein [Rhodococcus sp. CC-R104]